MSRSSETNPVAGVSVCLRVLIVRARVIGCFKACMANSTCPRLAGSPIRMRLLAFLLVPASSSLRQAFRCFQREVSAGLRSPTGKSKSGRVSTRPQWLGSPDVFRDPFQWEDSPTRILLPGNRWLIASMEKAFG
jgi:hypothetical protein